MKTTFFLIICIGFFSCNRTKPTDTQSVNSLITSWHLAAAHADFEEYFNIMDENSVFIGTDSNERWNKSEFISFAKPYFAAGKAWDFKPYTRNIMISENGKTAWFDEKLDTWMGVCFGSGVLENKGSEWKIVHYHLSIAIPNDKTKEILSLIYEQAE